MGSVIKKLALSIVAAVGAIILIPASSFAASAQTDVTGYVYGTNGKVVSGAKVTVICDNNSRKDTTDASGAYFVHFPATQCPKGATTYITATKSRKGGESTGKVAAGLTDKVNVSLVNVSLPEFGTIAGIGAALLGGGAFMVIRRRQLGGTQA